MAKIILLHTRGAAPLPAARSRSAGPVPSRAAPFPGPQARFPGPPDPGGSPRPSSRPSAELPRAGEKKLRGAFSYGNQAFGEAFVGGESVCVSPSFLSLPPPPPKKNPSPRPCSQR